MILLALLSSILAGQIMVRLTSKISSGPNSYSVGMMMMMMIIALKCILAAVLAHYLVDVGDVASVGNTSSWTLLLLAAFRVLVVTIGLWVGESFCPVALTGSIATGKSTVAEMLVAQSTTTSSNKKKKQRATEEEQTDVYLIDSDSIAHEILLPPSVLAGPADTKTAHKAYTVKPSESVFDQVCAAFPDDKEHFLDPDSGLIVRRKLGSVIFSNHVKRRTLNGITHPRIIRILIQRILVGVYLRRVPICCADVPLLFESGMLLRRLFCLVVCVATSKEIQYQRLRERNRDLSETDCQNRINSQYPMEQKVAGSDLVIWNNGTVAELEQRVREVKQIVKQRLHGGVSQSAVFLVIASLWLFHRSREP